MSAKVIAVAGKGGVGKTSVSAAVLRLLTERYPEARILAIDADPAVGLATALGVEARETLDDIRKALVSDAKKTSPEELTAEARFRLLDAMVETRGFAFLAIGRPEPAGCSGTVFWVGLEPVAVAVNELLNQSVGFHGLSSLPEKIISTYMPILWLLYHNYRPEATKNCWKSPKCCCQSLRPVLQ